MSETHGSDYSPDVHAIASGGGIAVLGNVCGRLATFLDHFESEIPAPASEELREIFEYAQERHQRYSAMLAENRRALLDNN